MEHKIKYLVLAITDKCNLECRYCYMGKCGKTVMTKDIIDRAVSFLPENEKCHVQITGGEPGLHPEMIAYAAEAVRSSGKNSTIGVQTNGTLIGDEFIYAVNKYHIQVGISLDGKTEINDGVRGNTNSVFHGMGALLNDNIVFRTTTVVSSENVASIHEIPYILAAFSNARGMALDMLVRKGRAAEHGMKMPSKEVMHDAIKRLVENLSFVNRAREYPIAFREAEKHNSYTGGAVYCHAVKSESMAVAVDGSIYPCGQVIGDRDFFCGNLDDFDGSFRRSLAESAESSENIAGCNRWDCPSRIYYNRNEAWPDIQQIFSMISIQNHYIH